MEWKYLPGQYPSVRPDQKPTSRAVAAYEKIVATTPLSKNFYRQRSDVLWRALDDEVMAGRLSPEEVQTLRSDREGAYTLPLASRYLAAGHAAALVRWVRGGPGFHDYGWIDQDRTTMPLLRMLQEHDATLEAAELATDHLWYRLVGVRYSPGLRQELRDWYRKRDRDARRKDVLGQRASFRHPHPVDNSIIWMEFIAKELRPSLRRAPLTISPGFRASRKRSPMSATNLSAT